MTPGEVFRIFMGIFGGVGLFVYGMKRTAGGLQKVAGKRMRDILSSLTDTPVKGTVIGALMAATIQSSSATTVMLVGFVNASLMTLTQAIGVVYGANIGTTFTVQLIAFRLADYSLLLIGTGVLLYVSKRNRLVQYLGQSILGFGFIFLGLKILSETTLPLRSYPGFVDAMVSMGAYPLFGIVVSAVFTGIIQSSAATIGIAMVLTSQGILDLSAAIPIFLGADIGTCSTALISSIGSNREGKRVAVAHLLFNLIGTMLIYPFMGQFHDLILWVSNPFTSSVSRQIANGHMLFKLLDTLVFLPLTVPFRKLIIFMLPIVPELERAFRVRYIDEQVLDTPEIALGEAYKEAERMGYRVLEMLKTSIIVFQEDDDYLRQKLKKMDNEIDFLDDAITRYLTTLSQGDLTVEQSQREVSLLYFVDDLEHIGDLIDKSLMELARKKIDLRLSFSPAGVQDIIRMHHQVCTHLQQAIRSFMEDDDGLARQLLDASSRIEQLEADLRLAHVKRLHGGLQETIDTSSIHLDVISTFKLISAHTANIAQVVSGEV
ncbi:MAG: Na/Pi cotransporter family protein [Deltaproteobacteria bacterium]|nr:Na/Pi cotransporter family protein [Deltaproteobacteria bacterium]